MTFLWYKLYFNFSPTFIFIEPHIKENLSVRVPSIQKNNKKDVGNTKKSIFVSYYFFV